VLDLQAQVLLLVEVVQGAILEVVPPEEQVLLLVVEILK
jgi:hypothetical protein